MKGKTNNPNGRPAGVPNRITKELRETLKEIIYQEFTGLTERLEKLEPKDRIEFLIKLLPFVLPRVEPLEPDYDIPGILTGWDSL